jgi:hypothetical protein
MKLKALMIITSIMGLFFGLSFFFYSAWTVTSSGVNLNMGGQYIARLLGSVYLGYAMLFWLARNSPNWKTQHSIVVSAFISMILVLILSIYDRAVGIENALAWSTFAIYLLLCIGDGYFAFIKPNDDLLTVAVISE